MNVILIVLGVALIWLAATGRLAAMIRALRGK